MDCLFLIWRHCGRPTLSLLVSKLPSSFVIQGFLSLSSGFNRLPVDALAGWVLSAYFLGGYGDDGRGVNSSTKAVLAAVKSWAVGIPVSINL